MRRFAAHYLLTETGNLLKNGLAEVATNGQINLIDTRDNLIEIERLIFHSGLLIKGFEYVRNTLSPDSFQDKTLPLHPLLADALKSTRLSLLQVTELAKHLQQELPGKTIPELLALIDQALLADRLFVKEPVPELYLLASIDLSTLRFKPGSKLKKII